VSFSINLQPFSKHFLTKNLFRTKLWWNSTKFSKIRLFLSNPTVEFVRIRIKASRSNFEFKFFGRIPNIFRNSSELTNFLSPKNYKPKLQLSIQKLQIYFHTKKLLVKCWWNGHLVINRCCCCCSWLTRRPDAKRPSMEVVTEPGPGFRGTLAMTDSLFNMTGRVGWNPRLPGLYPVSDPATDGALRPGINFINILRPASTRADPKSTKR